MRPLQLLLFPRPPGRPLPHSWVREAASGRTAVWAAGRAVPATRCGSRGPRHSIFTSGPGVRQRLSG